MALLPSAVPLPLAKRLWKTISLIHPPSLSCFPEAIHSNQPLSRHLHGCNHLMGFEHLLRRQQTVGGR